MERDIGLITNHPAVVSYRRDVKKVACFYFEDCSIIEGGCCCTGKDQADVFNMAAGSTNAWPDVLAPLPTRLIHGATNRHPTDVDQLKTTLLQSRTSWGDSNR